MQLFNNKIPGIRIDNTGRKPVIKGHITLPCWNGHFLYDEEERLQPVKVVTDGLVELRIDGEVGADGNFHLLDEQAYAYSFLVEHQQAVKQAIVDQLKAIFPRLLAHEYASWDHNVVFFPTPEELTPAFDFKNYIGPAAIAIGKEVKDGAAYVTWYFRCWWDTEHGIEVITHQERVIAIGPEVDPWEMYKDNGTYEQRNKAYEEKMATFTFPAAKKWWQFWKA